MTLNQKQVNEAITLLRAFAHYPCENHDIEGACSDTYKSRVEMCSPCQAGAFVNALGRRK